jgi:hypothetical protein
VLLETKNVFDWRSRNGVTPVKNQDGCGSCWDFAATAAFESAIFIKSWRVLDLSEQQVLSCNTGGGDCGGGWADYAYNLFISYGAVGETCMPYRADDTVPCTQDNCQVLASLYNYFDVANNTTAIKNALLSGPVSTTMTVYDDFDFYDGGCYEHSDDEDINHCVVIVGWDDSMCGGNGAWIVKNSWGNYWGDEGFFYIKYGSAGIGQYSQIPNFLFDDPFHTISPTAYVLTTTPRNPVHSGLRITNNSDLDITYEFTSYPAHWVVIEIEDQSGTVPGNQSIVVPISFEPHDSDIGDVLTGTITLSTSDPYDQTNNIPCQLTIVDPNAGNPMLSFDTSPVVDTLRPGTGVFIERTLRNHGRGTLEFEFSEDAAWLSIFPHTGSLGEDESINVRFKLVTSRLEIGDYSTVAALSHNCPDPDWPNPAYIDVNLFVRYEYLPGDANMQVGGWPPQVLGSDITYLVGYFRGLNPPCNLDGFYASADANGDCQIIGGDITRINSYLRGIIGLEYCPDYPPAWPTPNDIPAEAPPGWPNCE